MISELTFRVPKGERRSGLSEREREGARLANLEGARGPALFWIWLAQPGRVPSARPRRFGVGAGIESGLC